MHFFKKVEKKREEGEANSELVIPEGILNGKRT